MLFIVFFYSLKEVFKPSIGLWMKMAELPNISRKICCFRTTCKISFHFIKKGFIKKGNEASKVGENHFNFNTFFSLKSISFSIIYLDKSKTKKQQFLTVFHICRIAVVAFFALKCSFFTVWPKSCFSFKSSYF